MKSYASSSSSSGVLASYSKSLSQNLSRASSKSNCSAFDSIDFGNFATSLDLAGSLPSCTSSNTTLATAATERSSTDRSFGNSSSNNSCIHMPPVTSTSSMVCNSSTSTAAAAATSSAERSPVHFR